jgi:hypothetical protein
LLQAVKIAIRKLLYYKSVVDKIDVQLFGLPRTDVKDQGNGILRMKFSSDEKEEERPDWIN